jgi:hypothetical protein
MHWVREGACGLLVSRGNALSVQWVRLEPGTTLSPRNSRSQDELVGAAEQAPICRQHLPMLQECLMYRLGRCGESGPRVRLHNRESKNRQLLLSWWLGFSSRVDAGCTYGMNYESETEFLIANCKLNCSHWLGGVRLLSLSVRVPTQGDFATRHHTH